jgi:hypothetical protein
MLGRGPILREFFAALNFPSMIALAAWAFAVYPWQIALAGVIFFLVVVAWVQGVVLVLLGGSEAIAFIGRIRTPIDATVTLGALILWWFYYPL